MRCSNKTVSLVACLALIAAGFTLTRTLAAEAVPASSSSTTVAHVFLQTNEGLNVYDAASSGKLTLVKGSPFKTAGTWMEAATSSHLFSFDANHVYTYALSSSGVVGKQLAEIDTRDFDGADCSGSSANSATYKAILDHTGKSLYVQIFGYAPSVEGGVEAVCSAYQYYQVSSSGKLTFNGAYVWTSSCCSTSQMLTFTSSDKFVYGINAGGAAPELQYFIRESNGSLENINGSEEAPPQPSGSTSYTWQPNLVDADPSGHAAVMGIFQSNAVGGGTTGRKIGSYTVGGSGDLTTANTYAELVTPQITPLEFNFSPSGSYLAAGGEGIGSGGGLQVFHWNGSKPLTAFGGPLTTSSDIEVIHWDNSSHLYAVGVNNKLYVYTVTSSKISEVSGSPLSFSGALEGSGLIVIPVS